MKLKHIKNTSIIKSTTLVDSEGFLIEANYEIEKHTKRIEEGNSLDVGSGVTIDLVSVQLSINGLFCIDLLPVLKPEHIEFIENEINNLNK